MTPVLVLLASCGGGGGGGSGDPPTRPFAMGFTPFPYAVSLQAVDDTWDALGRDADLVAHHYDDGIPWQEAYDGTAYPADYQGWLTYAAATTPAGHLPYLAVTPLAFTRDRLANAITATGAVPPPAPWDSYAFDHPHVVTAFTNHCERMIAIFNPAFMAFGIEVNILPYYAPAKWAGFVSLVQSAYATLKAAHPALPLFLTLQADTYYGDPMGQAAAITQILPYTDYVAVSAYPYTGHADPATIPPDFFTPIASLAPSKRFAIAETGWPAEDVTSPYPIAIPETPARQDAYVQWLLDECTRRNAAFINWFLVRDYDDMWVAELQSLPTAPIVRLWKDIGFYEGAGAARPALATWRSTLSLQRR